MVSLFDRVKESAEFLKGRFRGKAPHIGIILGTGFGDVAGDLGATGFIFYKDIPNFPLPTVPGHEGKLWIGDRKGKAFVILQGRLHFYEGYTMEEITLPLRVLALWGVKLLIVTASVGGINEDLEAGELLLIKDHINLMGWNPLMGKEALSFGDRFVNMTEAYDPKLRKLLKDKFNLREAVYVALPGPCYETPAEVKALRLLGADVVGMSLVPEVIVARQMNLKVLGLVGVANLAGEASVTHSEVLSAMKSCRSRLKEVISFCLEEL